MGRSRGLRLSESQSKELTGIQTGIRRGIFTAAKFRLEQFQTHFEDLMNLLAKFVLMNLPDEAWYAIRSLILIGAGATLVDCHTLLVG